ncbi:amidohydrolase family protein [Nonomuraea antimicrobica]
MLDGTGAPPFRADVAVTGDRVAAVGRLDGARAGAVIDATGRFVAPGFVDCHAHGDAAVFDPAVQRAALRQGVTTFVLGQDGLSYAPGSAATVAFVSRYFAAVNGALTDGPLTVGELLDGYDRAAALNTAYLLPHGTIRYDVMGPRPTGRRPATWRRWSATSSEGSPRARPGCRAGSNTCRAATPTPRSWPPCAPRSAASRTSRTCVPTARRPGRAWRRSWRSPSAQARPCTSPTCTGPPTCCCRWSSRRSARASTSPTTPTPTCAATRSWRWPRCRRRCLARTRAPRWR